MPKKPSDVETAARINRTGIIIVAVIALVGTLVTAYLNSRGNVEMPAPASATEYLGRVLDADTQQPVANAKITLSLAGVPPVVYTDNEGVYRFNVALEASLSGQVRVDAQGYQVYTRNITISADARTLEDIRLTR